MYSSCGDVVVLLHMRKVKGSILSQGKRRLAFFFFFHLHTALRLWRCGTKSVNVEGHRFDPQPGQKLISIFFTCYKTILTHAKDCANFILFTISGLRG